MSALLEMVHLATVKTNATTAVVPTARMTVAIDQGHGIRDRREADRGRGTGMVVGIGGTGIGKQSEAGEMHGIKREGIGREVRVEVGVGIEDQR